MSYLLPALLLQSPIKTNIHSFIFWEIGELLLAAIQIFAGFWGHLLFTQQSQR